ncbi:MAG: hypothetical protein ACE5F1_09525 [Planctomycetota bacterium]
MKKALLLAFPVCLLLAFRAPVLNGNPPQWRWLELCDEEPIVDGDGTACELVVVSSPADNPPESLIVVTVNYSDGSSEQVTLSPGEQVVRICNINDVTAHETGSTGPTKVEWRVV